MRIYIPIFGAVVALLMFSPSLSAQETEITTGAHLMLGEFAGGSGGAAEVVVSGGYAVHPQVALALDGYAIFPLKIGSGGNSTDVVLRVAPTIALRIGDSQKYGYLKLGSGLDYQHYERMWKPAWAMVSALGYAVRPRELKIYFGFEFAGGIAVIGPKAMTIGVGGYIGLQL